MLAGSGVELLGPMSWADLGCGDGTFTLALADMLAEGSVIHAVDLDASALRGIPSNHHGVQISTHRTDFTTPPWPFDVVDGIIMANSLHYVRAQTALIRQCRTRMTSPHRFLIVEYDTDDPNAWVPYPVSRATLSTVFDQAGYSSISFLGSRPSVYHRAPLYAALITSPA
jgi:SAM-dependent methyltransferase